MNFLSSSTFSQQPQRVPSLQMVQEEIRRRDGIRSLSQTITEIKPQPGPQERFLSTPADIAIYGGAAGGGKSFALLIEPLRHIDNPNFGAVIFRRTLADVKKQGSLLDTSIAIYGTSDGRLRQQPDLLWRFPSGAKIGFGHLEHDKTVLDWQGAQVALLCFDELTHFTRAQFFYMLSRNRSMCGIRPYVRATTNPDADSWVAELIAWWIDQNTGLPIQERSGVLRYFARAGEKLVWADSDEELRARHPGCEPKSLTFIPAKLDDNAILIANDPGYRANLMALQRVDRERLLGGNWKIRPAAGLFFQRGWCQIVDAVPIGTQFVRGWDLAATSKTEHNNPDRTAGTKVGRMPDGRFIIAHHVRMWGSPLEVERLLKNTASADTTAVPIALPQDPAQAGKYQAAHLAQVLLGYRVRFAPASGDKITRFGAFSAQAEAGNVVVLRGPWNEDWFGALESFGPDVDHDDDADSTSEAFNELIGKRQLVISDAVLARARRAR